MTLSAILTALGSVAAIVGGFVYVFKYSTWLLTKTPQQKKEDIDRDQAAAQKEEQETGRPPS